MKYKKGNFLVLPNVEELKGKPCEMQIIYFWIVQHSDEDGICFPSREKIAKFSGIKSVRTIDKYMKLLVEGGFLSYTKRRKKNSKEYMSNLYQIMEIDGGANNALGGANEDILGGALNVPITIPSINYTNLTIKQPEVALPFSLEDELVKLETSSWKPNKIIALYLRFAKLRFQNKKQFDSEVKKQLRGAIALEGYTSTQIQATMEYCEKNYSEIGYNLYTVGKRIALIINGKI